MPILTYTVRFNVRGTTDSELHQRAVEHLGTLVADPSLYNIYITATEAADHPTSGVWRGKVECHYNPQLEQT